MASKSHIAHEMETCIELVWRITQKVYENVTTMNNVRHWI